MADFLTTMYGDGNACIGNKYGKTVVKAKDIYFNNDGHMTVNFLKWGGGRTTDNLSCLNALKFDLDTEKAGLSPTGAFQLLDEEIFGKNRLPYPTFVVNSGAGLHIYYKFDNVIRTDALDVYKRLEKTFCEYFRDYGIDTAASVNPVGVLRLPGTINEKHGNTVRIIFESGNIYSFRDLCDEYLSYADDEPATEKQLAFLANMERIFGVEFPERYKANKRNARKTINHNLNRYMIYNPVKPASEKQLKYIDKICKTIGKECPNIVSSYEANVWIKEHEALYKVSTDKYGITRTSMDLLRSKDLNVLNTLNVLLAYVNTHKANTYKREVALFYIRYCASCLYGIEEGKNIMLQANNLLDKPFREKDISRLTKSAQTYIQKNQSLRIGIKSVAYKITDNYDAFNEYSKSFIYVSKDHYAYDSMLKYKNYQIDYNTYRSDYQKDYHKKAYNKKVNGIYKKDKIENRQRFIAEHPEYSNKELAELLGVSLCTIKRDKNALKEKKYKKTAPEGGIKISHTIYYTPMVYPEDEVVCSPTTNGIITNNNTNILINNMDESILSDNLYPNYNPYPFGNSPYANHKDAFQNISPYHWGYELSTTNITTYIQNKDHYDSS